MTLRKIRNAITLNMIGKYFCLVQPEDLIHFTDNGSVPPVQIYMITRRPRITLDPATLKVTGELITGNFRVYRGRSTESHGFTMLNQLGTSEIRIESPAPHNMFYVYDENDEVISMGKAANLIPLCKEPLEDLLDLEVMYVGQTFGLEAARTSLNKIGDIKTLQAVCSDIECKTPDQEVWLVLWHFEQLSGPAAANPEFMSQEEEAVFLEKILGQNVSLKQAENFTEAALIQFFAPEYNNTSIYNLENKAAETYPGCYSLDVDSIIIELNMEELSCRLWSPQVEPEIMHYVHFSLNSSQERENLFAF
ncbi:MAG TPA: hypothetical protein VNT57_03610 [Desulfobacteria bacterium]|nr:hypothetical protein [Desulfobacteria bacterium]